MHIIKSMLDNRSSRITEGRISEVLLCYLSTCAVLALQDVDEDSCYRYPQLYIAGQQNKNFNIVIFVRSLIKGIYVSIVFFFVYFGMTFLNVFPDGYEWDYQSFGLAASGTLIIIVNLQVCVCMCVCVCLSACTCMSVCMYVSVCMCLSVCMCVCMYICVYVCLHMCLSVCMYVRLHIHVCVCLSARTCMCLSVCMYMYVCLHVCVCLSARTCRLYVHVCPSAYMCLSVCMYVHLHVCVCLSVCLSSCMSVGTCQLSLASVCNSLPACLQIALDTLTWNPIMHLFVWGSIISWFVVIPFVGASFLYGSFFTYTGVANEVLGTAQFWFFWPLASVIALTPTVVFRFMRLDLDPHLVDDVRLKVGKEGKKLFRRRTFKRKVPKHVAKSDKRTGYAFAHEEGFGKLITSGLGFGMPLHDVEVQHQRRLSLLINASQQGSQRGSPVPVRRQTGPEGGIRGGLFAATFTVAAVNRSLSKPDETAATAVDAQRDVDVDVHEESRSDSVAATDLSRAVLPGVVPMQSLKHEPGQQQVTMEILESTSPVEETNQ